MTHVVTRERTRGKGFRRHRQGRGARTAAGFGELAAFAGDLHTHRGIMRGQAEGLTQERHQLARTTGLRQATIRSFDDQLRIQRRQFAFAGFQLLHQRHHIGIRERGEGGVSEGGREGFDCGHQFGDAAVVECHPHRIHASILLPLTAGWNPKCPMRLAFSNFAP
nr:hypothetical protein [Nocardia yunnanensis]